MAQSGHHTRAEPCPLSGVKQTLIGGAVMSANDPKQTLPNPDPNHFQPGGLTRYDALSQALGQGHATALQSRIG
jgi:hypothetical protein